MLLVAGSHTESPKAVYNLEPFMTRNHTVGFPLKDEPKIIQRKERSSNHV